MNCPRCRKKTFVVKVVQLGCGALRYRQCRSCGHRFKTVEEADIEQPFLPVGNTVMKKA